jgi:hypothetical protein
MCMANATVERDAAGNRKLSKKRSSARWRLPAPAAWTAKVDIFAASLAITDLKLDEALLDYGPEAAEGRRILRDAIKTTIAEIWGDHDVDEEAVIHRFGYARTNLKARIAFLNTLQPASAGHRRLILKIQVDAPS